MNNLKAKVTPFIRLPTNMKCTPHTIKCHTLNKYEMTLSQTSNKYQTYTSYHRVNQMVSEILKWYLLSPCNPYFSWHLIFSPLRLLIKSTICKSRWKRTLKFPKFRIKTILNHFGRRFLEALKCKANTTRLDQIGAALTSLLIFYLAWLELELIILSYA